MLGYLYKLDSWAGCIVADPKDLLSLQGKLLVGRFQLIRLLGQGGYGAVFEAEQISIGRRCAVKVLAPRDLSDAKTTERFKMEAKATSRLSHPHTVTIYDFGQDNELGVLFLAMEYLEGRDLSSVMKTGELDIATSVRIIEQAAASLDDAHSHGIVHRDVKPQNIMVVPRGRDISFVKVIDFGIAKAFGQNGIQPNTQLTMTGTIVGTPQYMSPEQVRDIEMDGRSDQYSLAICLYQMLAGRPPFLGSSPIDIATRHLTDTPLPLGVLRPDLNLPPAFEEAVLKALSKAPEDRFKTVGEFATALRDGLHNTQPGSLRRLTDDVPVLGTQTIDLPLSAPPEGEDVEGAEEVRLPTTEVGKQPAANAPAYSTEIVDVVQGTTDEIPTTQPRLVFEEDGLVPEGKGHTVAVSSPEISRTLETLSASPVLEPSAAASSSKWIVVALGLAAFVGLGSWVIWPETKGEDDVPVEIEKPLEVAAIAMSQEPSKPEVQAESVDTDPHVEPEKPAVVEETPPEPKVVAKDVKTEKKVEEEIPQKKTILKTHEDKVIATGKVSVTLIPWGNLYVGTKDFGDKTRHSVELPEGRHRLSLRQDGETRVVKTVDVVAGQTKMVVLNANAP